MTSDFREPAAVCATRWNRLQPVYLAPEALDAYAALGFDRSPTGDQSGVARRAEVVLRQSRSVHGPGAGRDRGRRLRLLQPKVVEMAVAGGWPIAWSDAIVAAGSYPQRIAGVYNTGGGPHFGSGLTIDTAAELYGKKA